MNANTSIEPRLMRVAWTFRAPVHHLLLHWWCSMRWWFTACSWEMMTPFWN